MNIYEKLGVKTFINAFDSETVLGGSLMPSEVTQVMVDASKYFVKIEELERNVSEKIAQMTKNEASFVVNSAAAGLTISVAACITGTDLGKRDKLPFINELKNEVIIHRCQRNGFDHAIRQTGSSIVEIGNFMYTNQYELESAISDRTSCIVYFAGSIFEEGALQLDEVISIAKSKKVPVIVDASAQLPPVSNLWYYTEQGADLVIFSGGKTLRGPQASGFILGKKELIEACKINASPHYSIGRSMKIGKEEMVGLLYAIERYLSLDHDKVAQFYEESIERIQKNINFKGVNVKRLYPGPVGQSYPRAGVYFSKPSIAESVQSQLEQGSPSIITTLSNDQCGILINPLHLEEEEVGFIIERLHEILSSLKINT